jgi:hypothetical protein
MKSLKLNNQDMTVCVASMGKMFKVNAICRDDDEANEFCRKNPDSGVVACDANGLIYIAELYGRTIKSQLIKDFIN